MFNVLLFAFLATFVIYALSAPLLATDRAAGEILRSKRAQMAAESLAEELLYKMKRQLTVLPSETLTLSGASAEGSVSSGFGGRTIQVSASDAAAVRKLRIAVAESAGVSFHYGMQSGRGGFELYGGSSIVGNVYSNGPIRSYGGTTITGSATAANGSDPVLAAGNGAPGAPPQSIVFGGQIVWNDPKPERLAQSFKVATTAPLTSVSLYIKKYSDDWMGDATVRVMNDSSGKPGNTTLAQASLPVSQVTTSFNYLDLPFTSRPNLNPSATYWIVIEPQYDSGNQFIVGANQNGYGNGQAKTRNKDSTAWNNTVPAGLDMYFNLYVGGELGRIEGAQNDRMTIGGEAWAHTVSGANVSGALYCQGSSYANKACDTSRPDPVPQPFPVSDGNIQAWKDEAAAGGVQTGNFTAGNWPTQHVTLGPKKIVGNLYVTAGGSLTVTGTLHVTGNIIVDGGATVKLASSYGGQSGVIVADGRIIASGGGKFEGNGQSGNYILLVTTSSCPTGSCGGNPAISVSGGAGAVILNAQKGAIEMSGGASANQVTAERIIVTGGSHVIYQTGLVNMNFQSGPSGSWSVVSWDEI